MRNSISKSTGVIGNPDAAAMLKPQAGAAPLTATLLKKVKLKTEQKTLKATLTLSKAEARAIMNVVLSVIN